MAAFPAFADKIANENISDQFSRTKIAIHVIKGIRGI
jgi:hypothetical protein